MSTTISNGTIEFARELSPYEKRLVLAVVNYDLQETEMMYFDENDLCVSDFPRDMEDDLEGLAALCSKMDIPISEGRIVYTGDYDGSYCYVPEQSEFVALNMEETVICDAADEILIAQLRKRGYIVTKPEIHQFNDKEGK